MTAAHGGRDVGVTKVAGPSAALWAHIVVMPKASCVRWSGSVCVLAAAWACGGSGGSGGELAGSGSTEQAGSSPTHVQAGSPSAGAPAAIGGKGGGGSVPSDAGMSK